MVIPGADHPDGSEHEETESQSEPISLKNRMALYQAAVSKHDTPISSSMVLEEGEICSVPGGLARIRQQFEKEEIHTITQLQLTHTSEQRDQDLTFNTYSHDDVEEEEKETEEEEFYPKLSTKQLTQHFEKTIEEAAPIKKFKLEHTVSHSQRDLEVNTFHRTFRDQTSDMLSVSYGPAGGEAGYSNPVPPFDDKDLDDLPPPPPDLLEDPWEDADFPEPPEPTPPKNHNINKEQHMKQKELQELKRLCKHFNPEIRKDLERDFYNDVNEMDEHEEVGRQEQNAFEQSRSNESPETEDVEWDEIVSGEVQSMCWMFENKPLDCIKVSSDGDEDSNKITCHEIIAGGDVKNTALLFETQLMDMLELNTAKKSSYSAVGKKDVRAAAWLFETQPMDILNHMHDEPETKEVIFTQEATQSNGFMRYMFENHTMDSLTDCERMYENHLLSLTSVTEEIRDERKITVWIFESQCVCVLRECTGKMVEISRVLREEIEKGDVKTSRWIFETKPLDLINKDLSEVRLLSSILLEDNPQGDVKGGRWLFETKKVNVLNGESQTIQQKEEIIGADIRKQCMVFETQKDDSNSRPVTTEIIGCDVQSVRNLFETPPSDKIKELPEVGKLKKLMHLEENMGDLRHQKWVLENQPVEEIQKEEAEPGKLKTIKASNEEKGDVRHQKWLFENQKLEDIRDDKKEIIKMIDIEQTDEESYKGDVTRNCWMFETQPMDTLKDNSNVSSVNTEEIIVGDVQSVRQFFEAPPQDELKELSEVGKLKTQGPAEEEKGDVRHQKWVFENQPLEQIRDEKKVMMRTVDVGEIEKVDVNNYKQIFETYDQSQFDVSQRIQVEGVTKGFVKSNKDLFESTPMYAMQDRAGNYHEVKTVRREEIVKGNVKSCKWMFETRPIDCFDESLTKFNVIKGITQQEVESGDVKTAKWLFETQPLDAMKYFSNIEDEEIVDKGTTEILKGDVKTCKWLFETKPMDALYEKIELKSENETDEVQKGNVKTCTWLFETQTLDSLRDESETVLKASTVKQEDILGKDVSMVRFLFETENIESIAGEEGCTLKRMTDIDIQSGDVSRMKYIFESQSSEVMTSTSEEFLQQLRMTQAEDIEKGNVENCTWLFENHPIDQICENPDDVKELRTVSDIQGGNVDQGRFIFETYSLDKIQEVSSEAEIKKLQTKICEEQEKGDVKNFAMMFETQPLYAIQDKEGNYHEVTTLTKEEIVKGDVVGARWLFETKPLDSIRDSDEVYVIKSVTEEDIQKGDVSSARWKFETQPLDKITNQNQSSVKAVEHIRGGDVKANKERFESDVMSQKLVRTVSMSEIHKGDVKAAKWMFESRTIDQIHNENSEDTVEKVVMQEQVKGDVKQSVWLFEKNVLDSIKENGERKQVIREEIPRGDVKTTTWLFETTPFPDFNESSVEKTEIIGKSIKETLDELYSHKMVESKGILIEADEIGDVRMAMYNLMNKELPEIQKEEIIKGDLQSIMMKLLYRQETKEQGIVIGADERGNISNTVHQLFNQQGCTNTEKEEIIRGDIQEAINNLLKEQSYGKSGILIQEDEKGDVRMTIYSLFNNQDYNTTQKEEVIKGNVKDCLQKLYHSNTGQIAKIKVDETEKGKVSFYSTCIESGALDYLKELQMEVEEDEINNPEMEEIVSGDIEGTKQSLLHNQAPICRLVDREEIVPGDVHNTVRVFLTEPSVSSKPPQKEEIVGGDLRATLNSLTQSINQSVFLEKEEIVKGDVSTALKSLQKAHKEPKEVEKPEIIPGNVKGALKSLEDSVCTKAEIVIEDVVPGDIKGALHSLEEAKQAVRVMEKEQIVKGDIHSALQSLQGASMERKVDQQDVGVQGNVKETIHLLLEPPSSPRMQRRASIEGDVKLSIKSLYESQEQTQSEKEEVIKGDVKGTIKCLLETAQRVSPKSPRRKIIRKVKVPKVKVKTQQEIQSERSDTAEKKLTENIVSLDHKQELITTESVQCESTSQEKNKTNTQTSKLTTVEHNTISQTHEVKTIKTEFRNLKSKHKGLIKSEKSKINKQEAYLTPTPIPPPEPEFPLPPSPPPNYDSLSFPTPPPVIRGDTDLPPPPSPPPLCFGDQVKFNVDHLPPPPTPPPAPETELEFLPPPPPQTELDLIPNITPAKPKKLTVKPVKAPVVCKVPKLQPLIQFNQTDTQSQITTQGPTLTETFTVSAEQTQSVNSAVSSTLISSQIHSGISVELPESPKKGFVSMGLTPSTSPSPTPPSPLSKSPTSKSKSSSKPEQKSRQQQKEHQTPKILPALEVHTHESVSSVRKSLSSESKSTARSEKSISPDFSQEKSEKKPAEVTSVTETNDSSKIARSEVPPSQPLISSTNKKFPSESGGISTAKQQIISNQTSQGTTVQHQNTTSKKKKKYRSVTTCIQQVTSVSHSETIGNVTQESDNVQAKAQSKDHQTLSKSESKSNGAQLKHLKENGACTQLPDKAQTEESKKTKHEKISSDQAKPTESKSKCTEQKVHKAKKGRKKEDEKKPTEQTQGEKLEQEHVQVPEVNERNTTETEIKSTQNQPEDVLVSPKKKRKAKAKKDKDPAQQAQGQIQNNSTTLPAPILQSMNPITTSNPKQEETAVLQKPKPDQTGNTEVQKEIKITEGKVQQSLQHQDSTVTSPKQDKTCPKKKEQVSNPQNPDKAKDESRNVTEKSTQRKTFKILTEITPTSQSCAEAQNSEILSHITQLHEASEKMDSMSVKTLVNEIPEHLIGPEDKNRLVKAVDENNIETFREIVAHVYDLIQEKLLETESNAATVEKHECEATSENRATSRATQHISKITIDSKKVQIQKKSAEEKKEYNENCSLEGKYKNSPQPRSLSPSLRMRSPSPTFITIESTRRTDSPQIVSPSPPPPPPTVPPRRSGTPTSRLSRASPSPIRSRAESLNRLREATAKLSCGSSTDPKPVPVPDPVSITGKKSEIVEIPATFHRQIKIDSKASDEILFPEEVKLMRTDEEEGLNKACEQKDLPETPEHIRPYRQEREGELGDKAEGQHETDMPGTIDKSEMQENKKVNSTELSTGTTEKADSENKALDKDKQASEHDNAPTFNIKTLKSSFEKAEQSSSIKEQKHKQEKQVSRESQITSDCSKPLQTLQQISQGNSPLPQLLPQLRDEAMEKLDKPSAFSETQTITEHFSSIHESATVTTESRSTTNISKHSENTGSNRLPFSYADAVKKKIPEVSVSPEASAEELIRKFHDMWTESESVFKNLGCIDSDSSSTVGPVHSEQGEALPNGRPDGRQTEVP